MTEQKQKTSAKVGDSVDVKERARVTRPDGWEHVVTGGSYVFDVPGDFVVEGQDVTVK